MDILVHGKDIIKYMHEGRVYVEGRAGSEFTIRLRNNGARQVLAVLSVDGLSAMDGKPAGTDKGGYVMSPFSTLDVPGWRLNNDDVACFEFAGKGGSYAAKSGNDKRNVGVIACAFFDEHVQRYARPRSILRSTTITFDDPSDHAGEAMMDWMPVSDERGGFEHTCNDGDAPRSVYSMNAVDCAAPTSSTSFDMHVTDTTVPTGNFGGGQSRQRAQRRKQLSTKKGAQPVQNIGTGFGKQASHKVVDVEFKRMEKPAEVIEIYYDDRAGLHSRGIDTRRQVHVTPDPFPRDKQQGCEPPADWNG